METGEKKKKKKKIAMILDIIIFDKNEALRSSFKGQVRLPAFSLMQLQEMILQSQGN